MSLHDGHSGVLSKMPYIQFTLSTYYNSVNLKSTAWFGGVSCQCYVYSFEEGGTKLFCKFPKNFIKCYL
jgi:hypothetical protein